MSVLKFTPSHLWIKFDMGIGIVGVTEKAQTIPNIPALGTEVEKGKNSPVSGKVVEINTNSKDWLFKVALSRPGELSALLGEDEYKKIAKPKDKV